MNLDGRALAILEAALDLADGHQRDAFVTAQCGGDDQLATKVRQVLALEASDFRLLPTETFTAPLDLNETPPDRIGHYRVVDVIGQGGMGIVVKAQRDDGIFEQTVAIKIIRRGLTEPQMRARFTAERQILGKLIHPSIARILDGGECEGRPYLIMDYIEGQPVTGALDACAAHVNQRLDAFEKICEAVAHAHRNFVVHADIKPSNVLMTADSAVKLLDFGIAKLIVDLDADEVGEPYPLTRGYAAPERINGAQPTVAGDVYSLGALLHEVLTGRLPTTDGGQEKPDTVGWNHSFDRHGDLAAIIATAIADDPTERYPDVASLLADIRAFRGNHPVTARQPASWFYFADKFARRHRQGLVLTGIIIAILTLTSVVSTRLYFSAEAARTEASARFDDARGTARFLLFELMDRLQNQPAALPLRARVADVAQHYLDRLSGATHAPESVKLEAATGLWRLAEQQAKSGYPSLGLPQRAHANLTRAAMLVKTIGGPTAEQLSAHIALDRVQLAADMNGDIKAAESLMTQAEQDVARAKSHDPDLELHLIATRAALFNWEGKYADAIAAAKQGLARLTQPRTRDQILLANRLASLEADATYYAGNPRAAAGVYARRVTALQRARRAFPNDNFMLGMLARAQWDLATTLMQLNQPDQALPLLKVSDSEATQVLAFDPPDQEAVRDLRIIRSAYAQDLSMLGRHNEALALIAARVASDRTVALADPSNVRKQRDYAYSLLLLGEAYQRAHRYSHACDADGRALRIYDRIRRTGHVTPWDDSSNIKTAQERDASICK